MECFGQAWNIVPCLWECSAKHSTYITSLEDNLNSLENAIDELNNRSQDVKNRVNEAEEQQMKRTNEVSGWLQRVEVLEKEASQILQKGTNEIEGKCLGGCCPKNCQSRYKLGKKVMNMVPEITELTEKGKFDVVADNLPTPPMDELPIDNVVVGFESKFAEVWHCVQNKDSPVIGLVGMGGVGKTTLLKQLNNEFLKAAHDYDLVIWIAVPKPANLGRIQEIIRNKLNIMAHLWDNRDEGERAVLIFNKLKRKKFVVLLDDIWERLELSDVGIPPPSTGSISKVVFTTRSREVCHSMDAYKLVEMGCLSPDQAFRLFCSKAGEDMLKCHEEIKGLAKDVARECQGLPLALTTIGRAMRGKTDVQQWKDAKRALEKYPSTFPGMQDRVFTKLLFSYDSLPTQTVKKCFEYCSIFPEDHSIEKEEIIKLWLGEGLIDEHDSMHDALVQGRQTIEILMQASLLETGVHDGTVKMHDVIRDMALWLACERGKNKNKFWIDVVSSDPADVSGTPNPMMKWTNTEKVSLWRHDIIIEPLMGLSFCSNLVTLIIQDTKLREISGEAFHSMKVLKVLDLSYNRELKVLPAEIGGLANLEYLNIKKTRVGRLLAEVKQLKKMRFLIIDENTIIPREVISSLSILQTFEQFEQSDYVLEVVDKAERRAMEKEMLQELEGLKHIMDLRLLLISAVGIQMLWDSPKLQSCTSRLTLMMDESSAVVLDLGSETLTKHLERLYVDCCHMSVINLGRASLRNNLCDVSISGCEKIRNLSSLIYVPNLSNLKVDLCERIEELIGEDAGAGLGMSLFCSLKSLTLEHLPMLRSVCPQSALPFPSLKFMGVLYCPSLGKLPLDSNIVPRELKIEGHEEWWKELQWDSQASKDAFTAKFVHWDRLGFGFKLSS